MSSHAAATDIPIAQAIIAPKMAAVKWRKIVKIFLEYYKYIVLGNLHNISTMV